MRIKAIVVDDEANALDVLHHQLKTYCLDVDVVERCRGGKEAIEAIRVHSPDLVFLDIEMPHINGFGVLDATKDIKYKVIFTTAYDQFAVKAFKYSAIDYLLKPIDIEELKQAVAKVNLESNDDIQSRLVTLMDYIEKNNPTIERITIPVGNGYRIIKCDEIIRAESDSNYSVLYLTGGNKFLVSKTLSEIEKALPANIFYRIHNSHIVNLNFIKKAFKSEGGYVVMEDDSHVNISRMKKDEFWNMIEKI